ncbi:MAG: ABC transporter permease [Chloroflexi bacterium]|nr:ABC transporter permease [Chloroflexota bacterium]
MRSNFLKAQTQLPERTFVREARRASGTEGLIGVSLLAVFVTAALFAPLLAPYDPAAFVGRPLERPGAAFLLGTNDVGQDILSELLFGARVSLVVAVGAAVGTVLLGLLVGGVAGYLGGWVDAALMRGVDVLLALPQLPLIILITTLTGAGLAQMTLTMALLFSPGMARIIRAQMFNQRGRAYVKIAQRFGASPLYIFRRHMLPHLAPLLIVGLVTAAGRAAAMEAGLAFLGLGDPSAKSWGLMMRYALNLPGLLLTDRWLWWLLPPGLCITLLILALTFTGMRLEKRLNPGGQSS